MIFHYTPLHIPDSSAQVDPENPAMLKSTCWSSSICLEESVGVGIARSKVSDVLFWSPAGACGAFVGPFLDLDFSKHCFRDVQVPVPLFGVPFLDLDFKVLFSSPYYRHLKDVKSSFLGSCNIRPKP